MKKGISRRTFLAGSAALSSLAAGAAVGLNVAPALAAPANFPLPWVGGGVNVETVRSNAFTGYTTMGGCCIGTANGIIKTVRDALGAGAGGWDDIPLEMFKWGAGGGNIWGTLCGSLNSGLMMINIMLEGHADQGKAYDTLMTWYSRATLPTTASDGLSAQPVGTRSIANSPLCHASVSQYISKNLTATKETAQRKHRCARVAADTAVMVAHIINKAMIGAGYTMPTYQDMGWLTNLPAGKALTDPIEIAAISIAPSTAGADNDCMDCHAAATMDTASRDQKKWKQQGKMDCLICHEPQETVNNTVYSADVYPAHLDPNKKNAAKSCTK